MLRFPKLSRRSFLVVVAGTSGAAALAGPRLLKILDQLGHGVREDATRAARRVGRIYLSSHPEEADPALLQRALFGAAGGSWDDRRAAIAWEEACQSDFRAARLVAVEGWWLAQSEARLCALLYLSAGRTA
jgi:hypothetical protein